MLKNFSDIRNPFDLNGSWYIREDKTEDGLYFKNYSDFENQREITVPSDIAHCYPERPYTQGVFWYSRKFSVPSDYENKRIIIHFDAVNYDASVFINKKYVGSNHQGFLPFEFDVTDFVNVENENIIVVRVDTRREQGELPTSFYWKNCGGIIRDVNLYATEKTYIENVQIDAHAGGKTEIRIKSHIETESSIQIDIKDKDGKILFTETYFDVKKYEEKEFDVPNIKNWSPDEPNLYKAEISLLNGERIIDKVEYEIGFRDVCAKDGKILLNGEEIFLCGYNRHEDSIKFGGAANDETVIEDFAIIKNSGANFIRMCHYPHDERELFEADRLGLTLLVEIPLCAYGLKPTFGLKNDEAEAQNERVYANARECLERMIERDRNHPSVIIYSVSNENNEPSPEIIQNNNSLIQIAKKLDDTRLCTHVSNRSRKPERDTFFVYDDVICFNSYPTMAGRIYKNNKDFDIAEAGETMKETIIGLKKSFPEKPVICSEFGYRTNASIDAFEDEDIQAECVKYEFSAIKECANGGSIWIFADHLWENDPRLMNTVSEYGILKRDRKEKKAFKVYSDMMKNKSY